LLSTRQYYELHLILIAFCLLGPNYCWLTNRGILKGKMTVTTFIADFILWYLLYVHVDLMPIFAAARNQRQCCALEGKRR
jgi:hypothetical protein